ncbi:cytochrome bc1 complex cytochrome b subunit [Kytococcus sp. Marseille-QA3725]
MSTAAESRMARTTRPAPAAPAQRGPIENVATWVDARTGGAGFSKYLMRKVFPDHWSFMIGEIAMYSMVICLITGVFLTMWFVPSMAHTVYDGDYEPLRGIGLSEAYDSTLAISFDIKGGLLMRQIHHWAALIFIVAIMLHALRVFFTGAFRKPREINWVIGCALSMIAIFEGFMGYSLPDDLLSGTGVRAMQGFLMSAPIIGTYLSYWLFGGGFPGELIIPRFYAFHVLIIPAILVGLFAVHIILVAVHKHTQYPGPGRTNDNVVGFRVMPVYAAKAGGFFFIVFGLTVLISALVTINPVWAYGPYEPTQVTAGSQPDWYMGFADGALRLLPGTFEFVLFDRTFNMNIFPGSLFLIPFMYGLAMIYPFLESWVTGDDREHHLLQYPYNAPVRAGLGAAFFTVYCVLWAAAGNDLMAIKLGLSINDITNVLRVLFFVGPVIVFWVVKRICLSMQRRDRDKVLHGRESGRIVRTPEGRFFEAHEELSPYERWNLVQHPDYRALTAEEIAGTDEHGGQRPPSFKDKARARMTSFFFEDRIPVVTPAELAEARADEHHAHDHALDTQARTEVAAVEESLQGTKRH